MKDLSPFIRELLFSNDCVILPGFGGFIGNYTPARIDKDSHTFHPPVKTISFNSKLSHNDGLMIGKISEKKGIGYADAKRIVEDYISGIKKKLSGGERIHMAGIGHFQLNGEGSMQFEPDNDVNYLLDSYGLSVFTREPVEDYDISRAIISRRDIDPVVLANRRRMIWRAATAIPFVLALLLVPLKTDLFKSNAGMNPLAKVEFEDIKAAQDALFSEMSKTPDANETATVDTGEQTRPVEKELITGTRANIAEQEEAYHLIIGSFKNDDNAQRLIRDIATRGYNAELIRSQNGYYRVSAASFSTMQEAIDERNRLRDTFPGAWILKK